MTLRRSWYIVRGCLAIALTASACGSDSDTGSVALGSGGIASSSGGSGGNEQGGGGASATGGSTACRVMCAKAAEVECPVPIAQDQCVESCEWYTTMVTACASEWEAVVQCTGSRPVTDFECTDNGSAELRPGVCETEDDAFLDCYMAGAGPGETTAACETLCTKNEEANCPLFPGVDQCVSTCEASTSLSDACTDQWIITATCIANLPVSEVECDDVTGRIVPRSGACDAELDAYADCASVPGGP